VLSGFESRSARHVRETVEAQEHIPILRNAMMERAAFREIHITGQVPRQIDPKGSAAQNVAAITAELLEQIARLREDA